MTAILPSFKASDNRIVWTLRVEGDVPRWPDVEVEFELEVGPIPLDELARLEREGRDWG